MSGRKQGKKLDTKKDMKNSATGKSTASKTVKASRCNGPSNSFKPVKQGSHQGKISKIVTPDKNSQKKHGEKKPYLPTANLPDNLSCQQPLSKKNKNKKT